MASVETHTQFTGSHNDPEAQGTSGGEHLHTHTHINDAWLHETMARRFGNASKSLLTHSQVICCGSTYDGVKWPFGEALARSVVDEGHHDAIHPGWGQFHQLTGKRRRLDACVWSDFIMAPCYCLGVFQLRCKC